MGTKITIGIFILTLMSTGSALETSFLSDKIASSLNEKVSSVEYRKIALWRIINKSSLEYDENELRDYINNSLINGTSFDVIDRMRLQQIIAEGKTQGTEFGETLDPGQMKQLSESAGIDLFLYGTFYNNTIADKDNITLILKAIDVKKAKVAWAIELPVNRQYITTSLDLAIDRWVTSLSQSSGKISSKNINRISIWEISGVEKDKEKQIIDKFIVKISTDKYEIVDRESLKRLTDEIKASSLPNGTFDPTQAKEIGTTFNIDGFIYGTALMSLATRSELRLQIISIKDGSLPWSVIAVGELRQMELILNSAISFVLTVAILMI